ncbi:unnamed protein product [Symbiodinium sp. CCMP2592]|nr:unnamed protein product [Symbiodinium sp. CCMP2592]
MIPATPQVPWLPPWVATTGENTGHMPVAATSFQWTATHPSSSGAGGHLQSQAAQQPPLQQRQQSRHPHVPQQQAQATGTIPAAACQSQPPWANTGHQTQGGLHRVRYPPAYDPDTDPWSEPDDSPAVAQAQPQQPPTQAATPPQQKQPVPQEVQPAAATTSVRHQRTQDRTHQPQHPRAGVPGDEPPADSTQPVPGSSGDTDTRDTPPHDNTLQPQNHTTAGTPAQQTAPQRVHTTATTVEDNCRPKHPHREQDQAPPTPGEATATPCTATTSDQTTTEAVAGSVPDEETAPADTRGRPHTATTQTQAAAEAEAGRDPDAGTAQADTGDEPGDDKNPSDPEDDPDPDRPRSSEGHGSQRAKPGRDGASSTETKSDSRTNSKAGATVQEANLRTDRAAAAQTHAASTPAGEGTTPDQQPAEQPTIQEAWQLWTGETHPTSSTQPTSDPDIAQPADDPAHTASTEAQPQATPGVATTDNTIPPWEAQLQDEWADAQPPLFMGDIPPDLPIQSHTHANIVAGPHGAWIVSISNNMGEQPSTQTLASGLPRVVREGQEGTAVTAPPLTAGIVATFTAISDTRWVLEVTEAPTAGNHMPGTMLLAVGDRLLFEEVDNEWVIRVEALSAHPPADIRRLRQPAPGQRTAGGKTTPTLPPQPPMQTITEQTTDDTQTTDTGASSSHEAPHSYYPPARKQAPPNQPATATASSSHTGTSTASTATQQQPAFVDRRELRRNQHGRTPPQSTQAQPNPPNINRPPYTPLAAQIHDGRSIGPKKPHDQPHDRHQHDDNPDNDRSSLMQRSIFSASLPKLEDTAEDIQAADAQPLPPPPQPTQLEPTTLGDISMEADSAADNPQQHTSTAQAPHPQNQGSDPNPDPTHERSWQRVERHLEEIRRIISSHGGTTAEAIMRNADMALMHLLVDTPTAEELAATQDYNGPQAGGQAPQQQTLQPQPAVSSYCYTTAILQNPLEAARIATAALQNIARQQMSLGGTCISYGQLEPHVAALMQWLSSLHAGNIAVRVQLPPILEPLRRVLNKILTEDWALLIAVAEAMEKLLTGDNLTHPANVLAVAAGSHDTNLVERPGGPATWETAILQMQEWAADLDAWPAAHLPQVQEAAMRLVRGISARVPEEKQGQPDTSGEWWRFERHHGMGDLALFHGWTPQSPSSPRSRGTRRPRSPSSDASHRRRRVLAEHMHNHT